MFPTGFLDADRIALGQSPTSKKRTLEAAAGLLASAGTELEVDVVFDKLLERERLGSTGLGKGVALPHARVAGIDQAYGAFLQLTEGVDYEAIDGNPVDLIFALLVPEDANEEHLRILATLAGMFSSDDNCQQLRQAEQPEQVMQLLTQAETLAQSA